MTFIRRMLVAVCVLFSMQSYAGIVGDGAVLNWIPSSLNATCLVKQTSPSDPMLFPGGKGYYCEVNYNFLAQDAFCPTFGQAVGHFCSSTPSTYNSNGVQTFSNHVYGNNGSDWTYQGQRGNSWYCSGYPDTTCLFGGQW